MKRLNIRYLTLSLIIILSLLLGNSCLLPNIDISPSPTPLPPPITAPTSPDWTPPSVESNAPVLPDIAAVVAKVKPSVVAINTEIITRDIFGRTSKDKGAGSGWIIGEDGHIATNNHVVEGAESITITLVDGSTFPASIVGTDFLADLAVVKINAENLVKADLGDSSELRVGDWVVAIGNSLGLGISATKGIASSLGVSIPVSPGQTLHDLIQTDAAINPGNSGGPLVNMQGQVIGITSVKIATTGVEGMGYAISSNTVGPIIEQLITRGYVRRPFLGIHFSSVNQQLVGKYDLAVNEGVFIVEVTPDSPADKEAGLKAGDVIVGLNDEEIFTSDSLVQAIRSYQIGQRIKITFWRGNTENTTYATLTESQPP